MAKDKENTGLTELANGTSSFTMIGTVKLSDKSFGGATQREGSTWLGVNSNFGVEVREGNVVYPSIFGGYKLDDPVLRRFGKEGKQVSIPYNDRHNEKLLAAVSDFAFKKVAIEKDEDGKPILKKFIDDIDFEAYLSEHLKDGMAVRVYGKVDYSPSRDDVYRNYQIQSVYLNEGYEKDGEQIPPMEPQAFIKQTYLVDDMALESSFKKELKESGDTIVALSVPQYLSKVKAPNGQYMEWKKVTPLQQALHLKADVSNEKQVAVMQKVAEKMFKVKAGKVREVTLYAYINEGYETSAIGESEVSKEVQELIDMGLVSLEEVQKQTTVRGTRVRELVFFKPAFTKNDDGVDVLAIDDEKYVLEALTVPTFDEDDEDEEVTVEKDAVEDIYGESEDDGADSETSSLESLFG